jgi:hypothetical protein
MTDVTSFNGDPDLNFGPMRKELCNSKGSCKSAKSVTGTEVKLWCRLWGSWKKIASPLYLSTMVTRGKLVYKLNTAVSIPKVPYFAVRTG